ncbi:hypothetical protein AYK26_03860 [Euryarchaeota archaeon SM23-78]|nr:MAG: hypothetical protein AYK26_03860 [Euryarchaeota archaeon SM23-78]MBW3001101.1 hypothetical protein [Candidatus Woesearchaeota archaeon]
MGLKQDIIELMESLFGKDTRETFEKYYDESNPEELLLACKEMLSKLLGQESTEKHLRGIINKYPEIKKLEEVMGK